MLHFCTQFKIILIFLFITTYCQAGKIHISGKISNPVSEYLDFQRFHTPFSEPDVTRYTLKKDGSFEGYLEFESESYYRMYFGKKHITLYFLNEEADIKIHFDGLKMLETVVFQGKSAFLAKHLLESQRLSQQYLPNKSVLYGTDFKTFKTYNDKAKTALEAHFQDFKKANATLSAQFYDLQAANILYSWAYRYLKYPDFSRYYAETPKSDDSDKTQSYIDALNFKQGDLILALQYRSYLYGYLEKVFYDAAGGTTNTDLNFFTYKYELIDQIFPNAAIKEYLKTRTFYEILAEGNTKEPTPFYDIFVEQVKNKTYRSGIDRLYNRVVALKKGSIAPNIISQNEAGKTVQLSDFKGKYVYIDVWATWCKPCLKEMPLFNQLKSTFKGKNIAFWSISTDKRKERWASWLVKNPQSGHQSFISNGKGLMSNYQIQAIPRYILIDPDGKILEANALRPSQGVDRFLKKLLK